MELKSWKISDRYIKTHSSNRTFMELKLHIYFQVLQLLTVLIAPLWNWNKESFISAIKKGEF